MRVLELDTVDSTNTYALRHLAEVADSVLVSAREQTAGRGRLGRRWIAPPGRNITASFAMTRVAAGFHAGAVVGLAALDLVREAVPEADPYFKWPNDIYVGGAKLAGILCEGVLTRGELAGVVAGIGINVNLSAADVAKIDQPATSLELLSGGRSFSVDSLVERLAFFIAKWYINYDRNNNMVLAEWRRENRLLQRTIEVVEPTGERVTGCFSAIDDDGSMILETPRGARIFRCGDVRIARNFDPTIQGPTSGAGENSAAGRSKHTGKEDRG